MMDKIQLRPAAPEDSEAIRDLNTRAFGQPDEARIIAQLEKDGDALLQLVAVMEGAVVGHILFYPIGVYGKLGAVGLGPMSVDPWVQKEGIGSAMVMHGLRHLKEAGVPLVFVLGHAEYYPRFGFNVAEAEPFETPLRGPNFMALRMRYGPPMSGRLIFPAAFGV